MIEPIDLLVGAYGFTDNFEAQVTAYLQSLREKNNLDTVNVFCVERSHRPLSAVLKETILRYGFNLRSCPLTPFNNSCEDTGQFTDWMVNNVGGAPWVIVSHYDVRFNGDYIGFVRANVQTADMIGNHREGLVAISREAYRQCQVGFCRLDNLRIVSAGGDKCIISTSTPSTELGQRLLCFDVGELLALRVATLGLRHLWLWRGSDPGKSDLFTHTRRGSGHGGKGGDGDA